MKCGMQLERPHSVYRAFDVACLLRLSLRGVGLHQTGKEFPQIPISGDSLPILTLVIRRYILVGMLAARNPIDALIGPLCERAQTRGMVHRDVEPADAAGLLIAMVEGYGSLAKNAQDPKVMKGGSETSWTGCGPCARRATANGSDASLLMDSLTLLHTNRFVGSAIRIDCRHTEARADEGLMEGEKRSDHPSE